MDELPQKTSHEEDTEKIEIYPSIDALQLIRGLPIAFKFKKENVEAICDFMPADGDIIIATYPKTGTTWMQYIILQILTRGESFPAFNDVTMKVVPFLEMSGLSAVEEMTTRPRVYKYHLPYNMVQKNPKAKIVYVYRKPEDTLVSFYHFHRNMHVMVEFDDYFERFTSGKVSYGRYFEHILSFLKHKDDGNILFVSYEKLQVNRKEEILRVAKFLGEEYYNILSNDESVLNKIIEHTTFDYMKNNLTLTMPVDSKASLEKESPSKDKPMIKVDFFRKGVVGDGKTSLKDHQLLRLKELAKETMEGTDILLEWFQE